jgi:hypothetical protein
MCQYLVSLGCLGGLISLGYLVNIGYLSGLGDLGCPSGPPTYLPPYVFTYLATCQNLNGYIPTNLLTYLPKYLSTYQATCPNLNGYLPTYLSTYKVMCPIKFDWS